MTAAGIVVIVEASQQESVLHLFPRENYTGYSETRHRVRGE
jgi:hypothetical protein